MRLFCGLFVVIGLGLLAGGVLALGHARHFVETALTAQGVVTANGQGPASGRSHMFYPRIRFRTGDGRQISFVSSTGSRPPAYRVNESVTVLYDPQDPYHASIKSVINLWGLPIILGGLGIVFISVGGVPFAVMRMNARRNEWLRQNGRRIQAQFSRVELNTMVSVNGLHPYFIVCQWLDPANNRIHIFRSANIAFDPTSYIQAKTLEVLIDPNDPGRYLVETSFLPKVM